MSYPGRTGKTEIIDLALSLVALTIAFSVLGEKGIPEMEIFFISAVGVGTGFLLHELAHKFVAQRYGYWAEYQANYFGLVAVVAMAFMGFIFAAPGAVMIRRDPTAFRPYQPYQSHQPYQSYQSYELPQHQTTPIPDGSPFPAEQVGELDQKEKKELLWISLAGPMTNIVLTIAFFLLGIGGAVTGNELLFKAAYFAFFINLTLAAFNLIPVGPLDGAKVLKGSPLIWGIVAIPTILLALPVYLGMI
jgi:Zn-dependent protease